MYYYIFPQPYVHPNCHIFELNDFSIDKINLKVQTSRPACQLRPLSAILRPLSAIPHNGLTLGCRGWPALIYLLGTPLKKVSRKEPILLYLYKRWFFALRAYTAWSVKTCQLLFYSNNWTELLIWAATWDSQQCGMYHQERFRPACAYAQSDQILC